jgi:hypothetical protein
MSGLGTVLDRLQGLFGKGYLVAGFLPALVFVLLNLGLGAWVSPVVRDLIRVLASLEAGDQVSVYLVLAFVVGLFGFLLWSLNPWLRILLQGRALPTFVQELLRRRQRDELRELEMELASWRRELWAFRRATRSDAPDSWLGQLQQITSDRANADAEPAPEQPEGDAVLGRLEELKTEVPPPRFEIVNQLFGEVVRRMPTAARHDAYRMQSTFQDLARRCLNATDAAYRRLLSERAANYPEHEADLAPTRMANRWRVDNDYAWRRYQMDLEVFWPRLQRILHSEGASSLVDEKETQLSFATAMTTVSIVLVMMWWPLTVWGIRSSTIYALAVGLALVMVVSFYQAAALASAAYGSAVRSAVDLHRLDLLHSLGVERPRDSDEEREIWGRLTAQAELLPAGAVQFEQEGSVDAGDAEPVVDPPSGSLFGRIRRLVGR